MATPDQLGRDAPAPADPTSPYVVLARKYRPLSFAGLIGQDAMVRTLTNAFASGRIHHAFILTGVRGVGKTTTARILARAFNYEDADGKRPTLDLEVEGEHCRAIIEGRHVDVIEMDAASNTGIGDIREIIESVRFGPATAAYKVFIIDEVHMLSTAAFNGLLKTLEEPPPYVKFIFATTEIRKVPVTILSRCMRFDLRRVSPETMTAHLTALLEREGIGFEPDALAMIVRAGEGSVRDCQSLLDQAIAHGGGAITADTVRAMLGLADSGLVIDLFEALMGGEIAPALGLLRDLYDAGADPQTVLADLAALTHLVTRLKIVPEAAEDPGLTPDERSRGAALAGRLGLRALARAWQMLFHGLSEVGQAANALQAAEMVLIRLAHAAELPTPDEVIAALDAAPAAAPAPPRPAPPRPPAGNGGGGSAAARRLPEAPPAPAAAGPQAEARAMPQDFAELVALAGAERDLVVKRALEADMRPIGFEPGRLEVALVDGADPAIIATLSARLKSWTGRNWMVTVSSAPVATPTLRESRAAAEAAESAAAHDDPFVRQVLETFPGSKVVNVTMKPGPAPDPAAEAFDGIEEEEDE